MTAGYSYLTTWLVTCETCGVVIEHNHTGIHDQWHGFDPQSG